MASVSQKKRINPPKGRPPSTSALSQPVVHDASLHVALSSFSPSGALFAFLSLAVDKHCLRVYDTTSGQSTAEHVVDSARVTALAWAPFNLSAGPRTSTEDGSDVSGRKKRRKRRDAVVDIEGGSPAAIEVVVLGLSDGSLSILSPTDGRVLRSLHTSSSNSSVLSAAVGQGLDDNTIIWTSSSDAAIRLWNATKNILIGTWKSDDTYATMALRPTSIEEEATGSQILVANHGIRLVSMKIDFARGSHLGSQKLHQLATFTGHASSITQLRWDMSQNPPERFFSIAQADRFVYVWQLPTLQSGLPVEGRIVASIPLDSNARFFSLSRSADAPLSAPSKQSILTLSASGKLCVFPLPSELVVPLGSKKSHHKIPTLLPRSTITFSANKTSSTLQIVGASILGEEGRARVAKLVGGVRPVFEIIVCPFVQGNYGNFIYIRIIWISRAITSKT